MSETAYRRLEARDGELVHHYGDHVHLLADPLALTWLTRLCEPDCSQPEVNTLVTRLYRGLVREVANRAFPRAVVRRKTRMAALVEEGVYEGQIIDPNTKVTTVDIARAGILPSMVCFEALCEILDPALVRQDHLMMNRLTDTDEKVTGAGLFGSKIAGPIDDAMLLFPDPMGATGSSLLRALEYYREKVEGTPRTVFALHLIVTPEYIRRVTDATDGQLQVYAWRLDRGLSPADVLEQTPGADWARERGLTDTQYIVPGAGGMGEIMNNALS
jgi:uracil phosphoribosyltransferase